MPLLEWRCPPDVAGFVVPGGINAVERHSGGAISNGAQNVFQEDFEAIGPGCVHRGAFELRSI